MVTAIDSLLARGHDDTSNYKLLFVGTNLLYCVQFYNETTRDCRITAASTTRKLG